jgi:uncharacterized C2H2 Zn-finger protein
MCSSVSDATRALDVRFAAAKVTSKSSLRRLLSCVLMLFRQDRTVSMVVGKPHLNQKNWGTKKKPEKEILKKSQTYLS